MALVTDKDWVRHGVSAFGWLARGEPRLFEPRERDEARAWLGELSSGSSRQAALTGIDSPQARVQEKGDTVQKFDTLLEEREVVEDARGWWLFFLTGVAWLVFAVIVFQWDYTTVYAISFLFGVVAVSAGVNEFVQITVSTRGWKIARSILGVLFIVAGLWALLHPDNAFRTLAALIGLFFLFKGIFDLTVAFRTRTQFDVWWLQLTVGVVEILLAFWVAGAFREKTILLVVYVGIIALTRGITELLLAFKLLGGTGGGGTLRPA